MWFSTRKPVLPKYSDDVVRQYALRRLARVFDVSEEDLSYNLQFGQDLTASPTSYLKQNAFDIIDSDIKDVADRAIRKEMEKGILVIQTVRDYCEHMIRCSSIKPDEVAYILQLPAEK